MNPPATSSAPASAPAVGPGTRAAYGASAFAENLAINSINQLANAVFNLTLGVPLLLVGLALSLPRLIDVFLDPLVGNWSDRLRSRWGRRRRPSDSGSPSARGSVTSSGGTRASCSDTADA